MHAFSLRRLGALGVAAALAFAAPRSSFAQGGDGFLFEAPIISLSVRGGFDHANAGGQLFDQTIADYSLSRGSFSGGSLAADLIVRAGQRFAVVAGTGLSAGGGPSHFRHFVDNANHEIEQSTSFRRVPVTLGMRAYLTPTGRSIGRYAWVPARLAAYVGAGGGVMHYSFRQGGDFIAPDSAVYGDVLESSGWSPTAHALAGLDYSLSPHLALTGEGRYTWARGDVNTDYVGFDRIDLGGFAATVGLSVRF